METRNKYHFYRKELSKLLKYQDNVSFHKDEEVIDRIINLLSEGKSIDKIRGIISTTEIVTYGGDISDKKVDQIYNQIIEWWDEKKNGI